MKIVYKHDLNDTYLQIEVPVFYEEDYQMSMLRANKIPGIIPVTGLGIDGNSRYAYNVSGMVSMKAMFEKSKIERSDMEVFIDRLVQVIKTLKDYMLDAGRLLLRPDHIFYRKEKFYFCYLPVQEAQLCKKFHELTEYFVSQVNYEEKEGIHLAYELHKATMEEHYNIEQILEEFKAQEAEEKLLLENEARGNFFEIEDADEDEDYQDVQSVQEMSGTWGRLKKAFQHKKREKWGIWDGLVTEDEITDEL